MSTIDIPQLLQEVSPDSPCGADLAYDPAFLELELASARKPEQQMGDSIKPAEEPRWPEVKSKALELLRRTKDLRVAVTLTRSLLRTDGPEGLRDGLEVVTGLIERYWDGVHPRLDPEDGNDPTMRLNALASLSDWDGMVRPVREMPLVITRTLGCYSLRDIEIASGAASKQPGDETPEMAVVDQAFLEADVDQLERTAQRLRGALESAGKIVSQVSARVGGSQAVGLERLTSCLKSANQILAGQLARRGAAPPPGGDRHAPGEVVVQARAVPGEITTREDVVRLLDMACEYFKRHEPSSPVPLLLQRAKRLVSKDFLEIVKDLAPGGVAEVKSVGGLDSGE